MMQQFMEIKKRHKDSILFFRMGDFYEMFMDDAKIGSRILEITLTARDGGQAGKVPMCGIPFHSADGYIAKLIAAGMKVAICEQVEDPATAKGLVKRDVVRVITPGTYQDAPPDTLNYIVAWHQAASQSVLVAVEYTTGSVVLFPFVGERAAQLAADEIARLSPREAIMPENIPEPITTALQRVDALERKVVGIDTASARELYSLINASTILPDEFVTPLGEIVHYLQQVMVGGFGHFTAPIINSRSQVMSLDLTTRRNLELTRTLRNGEREGSLLWVLDHTVTSMGARLIKLWLEQPLLNIHHIEQRLSAVEELINRGVMRQDLRDSFEGVYDLERLLARVTSTMASPRDLLALAKSLAKVGEIKQVLDSVAAEMLVDITGGLDPHRELNETLLKALDDSPPISSRDGGIVREGFDQEIDRLRSISRDGKSFLAALEARERESTGIRTLKIGFNKVFGYFLEATKANTDQIPPHYHRKQTLVNAERYITEELKEYESTVLTAEDRLKSLEYDLFVALREQVASYSHSIIQVARRLSELDVLQSLAEAASRYRYNRPQVTNGGAVNITGGRHPVVERIVGTHAFVPNDTELSRGEIAVITGPNMAGKSTYMRQVALIVLMAQIGSFVPVEKAEIGLVDRVFTRVGAADDLYSGQSTFMVEMTETGLALSEATERSLILFDEVGRGTSTYDGMALAQAIMEYVHEKVKARTLFSTHYHELTSLADNLARCRNYTVAILDRGREVIFLRRVQQGKASKSYGIHVAELAGLPRMVTERAYTVLRQLEQRQKTGPAQINFFDFVAETAATTVPDEHTELALEVLDRLNSIAPDALTPLQALNLLYELKTQAQGK
ncbi:MAG: DNA mismatch repair protein MutS [Bacillota bacterium]|nr:DNA mismatch repair protein MutS [Bacillota bacterium]